MVQSSSSLTFLIKRLIKFDTDSCCQVTANGGNFNQGGATGFLNKQVPEINMC